MASALSQRAFLGSAPSLAKSQRVTAGRQRMQVQARMASKSKSKAAAYVCVDCGYIYDGSQGSWEDLPAGYKCPVCASPKKRFREFEGAVPRGNDPKSMQKRRDQLRAQLEERGEKVEEDASFLYITAGVTIAGLLGFAYLALNR